MPADIVSLLAWKALLNRHTDRKDCASAAVKTATISKRWVGSLMNGILHNIAGKHSASLLLSNRKSSFSALSVREQQMIIQLPDGSLQSLHIQGDYLSRLGSQLKRLVAGKHSLSNEDDQLLTTAICTLSGIQPAVVELILLPVIIKTSVKCTVLIEWPASDSLVQSLQELGINWLPVPLDQEGISVARLERLLKDDTVSSDDSQIILYTLPTGHNPTGVSTSNTRRQLIYQLCSERNVLIIEHDQYYCAANSPSYLSMDMSAESKRVIHIDSSLGTLFGPQFDFQLVSIPSSTGVGYANGWVDALKPTDQQACNILSCLLDQINIKEYSEKWNAMQNTKRTVALSRIRAELSALLDQQLPGMLELVMPPPPQYGSLIWIQINGFNQIDDSILYSYNRLYRSYSHDCKQWTLHASIDFTQAFTVERLLKAVRQCIQFEMQSRNSSRQSSISIDI